MSAGSARPNLIAADRRSQPIRRARGDHPRRSRVVRVRDGHRDDPVDAASQQHPRTTVQACTARQTRVLARGRRSEEHTSELQSLMRISYAVFCLKKKKQLKTTYTTTSHHLHNPFNSYR